MLTSLVERLQGKNRGPQASRYAAWAKALRRLEKDCARKSPPDIEDLDSYVEALPPSQRPEALQDLVAIHLRSCWAEGCGQSLDAYVGEIEALGPVESLPVDLIEDEFLARYQQPHGDLAELRSYEQRFASRPEVAARLRSRYLDSGRYLKLHRIGVGSRAIVWEGFDLGACRKVAIKEPLVSVQGADVDLRPFAAEAAITATLNHPGIVSMVEVTRGEHDPSFYVMRLAGRTTLDEQVADCHYRLERYRKSPGPQRTLEKLLGAVARVCDAIDHAHGQGLLHCDLKPANVVCNERFDIGVIDWGMAVPIVESQSAQAGGEKGEVASRRRLAGTPDYMAPEQMDGLFDVRTEVFSLGAILYETLTGRPPYLWTPQPGEERPADWPEQVRAGAFPRPRKVRRAIPRPLESVCRKAMAVNPDHRYGSAAELAAELRECLSVASGE